MGNQIFNKLRRAAHRLGSLWQQIRRSGKADLLVQAADPSTTSEVLEMLCSHQDPEVVMTAMSNPQLNAETVNRLAGHSSTLVRRVVAGHHYCRTDALLALCDDPDPTIARKAVVRLMDSASPADRLRLVEAGPAREYLRQLMNDDDPKVSTAARRALSQMDAERHDALLASFSAVTEESSADAVVGPPSSIAETPAEDIPSKIGETENATSAITATEQLEAQDFEAAGASSGSQGEKNTEPTDRIAAVGIIVQESAQDEDISSVSGTDYTHDGSTQEERQEAGANETLQNFWAVPPEDLYEVLDAADESTAYVAEIDPLEDRAHRMAHQLVVAYDWDDGFDTLKAVLVRENLGQIRVAIEKEIQLGMTPEELQLAMELRDYWREFGMEGRNSLLGWRDTLALIRAFNGYPTLTELTVFLNMMYERYERYPKRLYRTFSLFLWAMLRPASGSNPGEFDVLYLELTA